MSSNGDVLVFLESSDGERIEITEGLLTEGYRIAKSLNGNLRAINVGTSKIETDILKRYGVCHLYYVEGDDLFEYSGETYAWALANAVKSTHFSLLLFGHTDRGGELAPRVAFHLGTVAVTNCIDITVRKRTLCYRRHVYEDQLEQEVSYALPYREIASWRTDFLNNREVQEQVSLEVERINVTIPKDIARTKVIDIVAPEYQTVDILHAERIIGVGAGCMDSEILRMVEELSHLLEGSLGATRPVVDEGVLSKDRMIGQTGKSISSAAYLALGISGSPHHVAGIQKAKRILSVNRDPRAPIFAVADVGFVCDLRNLLPKLIRLIEHYRDCVS